jgi:adenine nucleotide transporter 17
MQGLGGLFGGLGTALFGTAISQGVYFYLYSLLRALAVERRQLAEARAARAAGAAAPVGRSQDVTVAESLLVAALAGAGNVLLTNPIWMVATRIQAQRRAKPSAAGQQQGAGAAGGESAVDVEDIDLPPPTFLSGAA